MASSAHVSDLGGCEGRIGRQHRNGGIGMCLWCSEGRQHLVSHQSPRRSSLSRIPQPRDNAALFISSRQFRDRFCSARPRVHLGWAGLRRNASHVATPSHCGWGIICPRFVVGAALPNPRSVESVARGPHRLVLVRCLASGIWNRGRPRGRAPAEYSYPRGCVVRSPSRNRSFRTYLTTRERREAPMSRIPYLSAFAVLPLVLLSACSTPNGQPQKGSEPVAPNRVVDFGTLYAQNCAGCNGAEGRGGASIALANPVYLAIVDENAVHNVVANGVRGTSMPAFAQSAGGLLTDEQITVITSGIFSRWGRKRSLDGANPPSYSARTTGDATHGEIVFGTYCSSCHGTEGHGGSNGIAIRIDSFLSRVSDRGLRPM